MITKTLDFLVKNKPLAVPAIIVGGSVFALLLAYISQYVFGLQPCPLCYYQRYPYWAAIAIGVILFYIPFNYKKIYGLILIIAISLLIVDAGTAFYHMGVEYKWFGGLAECGDDTSAGSVQDLLAQIEATNAIRCDEPAFVIILSMAGWNFVYLLAMIAATLLVFFKKESKS
jgi:disulfide bond formation protein DsbB